MSTRRTSRLAPLPFRFPRLLAWLHKVSAPRGPQGLHKEPLTKCRHGFVCGECYIDSCRDVRRRHMPTGRPPRATPAHFYPPLALPAARKMVLDAGDLDAVRVRDAFCSGANWYEDNLSTVKPPPVSAGFAEWLGGDTLHRPNW